MKKFRLVLLFLILFFFIIIFVISKIYFQPVAIVVPHHNIVADKRLEYFKKIAKKRLVTKKIIIVGPDHFSPNQLNLSYSNINWKIDDTEIKFSKTLELQLKSSLSLHNGVVKNDHSIFNLLNDIKIVWPKTEIFPILIGQNYPVSGLHNLINKLNRVCGEDCLLIFSVDFSHYLPAELADVHDQKSIYDLSTQNLIEIPKLEVDSPQSLYVMAKFSQLKKAYGWDLFYHSNSGELEHNYDIETTSHIFGSYQKIFIKNNLPEIKTYLISKNIDKKKSLNSLGYRFFYGTDYIDLDYSSNSSFTLPFEIDNDYVVTAVISNTKSTFKFFPTKTKDGVTYLLRGDEKKAKKIEKIINTK